MSHTPDKLRVASYNIHRCIGIDGDYRPDRIRDILNAMSAQIIALQEVESGPSHNELLDYFTQRDDWSAIEGPTLQRQDGKYGNAVLTSLPVNSVHRLDLSVRGREPRGALDLTVSYQGRPVRVIATHLGLLPGERRQQTRRLLDWLGPPRRDQSTLLLGDLNEWLLWGRPLRWLRRWFGATPAIGTFPTRWPVLALDRIWMQPRHQLVQLEVMRNKLTREASDHLPVIANLRMH